MAHLCFASKLKLSVTFGLIVISTLVFGQTVDFNINNSSQCYTGNKFIFTNNSTAGASAYLWNFGDGTTSTIANPTKVYTNSGNYSVQLMVTYNSINYYLNKTVNVNPIPVCGFNYYAATNTGNSYSFQSTSYINSGYANYTWNFGDSSTAVGTNPTHIFGHNGSFTINMTALSDKGCSCSTTQNILVTVSAPNVAGNMGFNVNTSSQCLTNNSFYFNNTSYNISGATYSWDFGDGSTSTTFSPTHSYRYAGTFTVSLIATVSGNNYTKTQVVTVQPKTSVTIGSDATKICKGTAVNYTASAYNFYGTPTYQWKVNNNNAGTNSSSFSTSTLSDNDIVTCIMTANNTCWASETDSSNAIPISVTTPTTPALSISSNTTSICAASSVTITANVTNSTYQSSFNFKVNGSSVQNSSFNTYTTKLIKDSTVVTVETMAGNTCKTSALYTSNALVFRYNKTNGNVWTGNVDSNFTTKENWCWDSIPANATIQTIANNRYPVLASNVTLNNLVLSAGTTLVIGNNTLTVNGTITGTGNIRGSNNSSIIINSATPNILNLDTTIINGNPQNSLKNLTISKGSLKLVTDLNVSGIISVNSGTLDVNNRKVKLISCAAGTAGIDMVNDSIHGSIINANNVVIQRYHAAKRAWNLISAPLTAAGTNCTGDIYSNWQQDTYITGPASVTSGGLDSGVNNTYGMLNWLGTSWGKVTDTKSNYTLFGNAGGTTADNKPFFLFIRGDRTVKPTSGSASSSIVVLEAKGALQTGKKTYSLPAGSTYALVANPYPATIDLELFRQQNSGYTTFYYWDPNLSGTGGYTTAIYNGGWIFSAVGSNNNKPRYIQSGQAFFIERKNGTTAVFNESQKSVSNNSNAVFGSNSITTLTVTLSKANSMIDAVVGLYNNNFSTAIIKGEDAYKFNGNEENISIAQNGSSLSINAKPEVTDTDTMYLNTNKMVAGTTYNFNITATNMPATLSGNLVDNYLHTNNALNLNDSNNISFTVDTLAASKAANRFMIILSKKSSLPVTGFTLKGKAGKQQSTLSWHVVTEKDVNNYTIEKSKDGSHFSPIYSIAALNINNSNYAYTDLINNNGNIYYRIKMTDHNGGFQYSNTIELNNGTDATITVYPNPAVSNVTVHTAFANGLLSIMDMSGKIYLTRSINSTITPLDIKGLKQGMYTVAIQNEEGRKTTEMIVGE